MGPAGVVAVIAWPEALAGVYPLPPEAVRARPWWRSLPGGTDRTLVRTDGLRLDREVPGKYHIVGPPGGLPLSEGPNLRIEDDAALLAQVDGWRPVPHPGFRAGQVWADTAGMVVVITEQNPSIETTHVRVGAQWLSVGEAERGLCHLLADPCCPWLAPWASADVSPTLNREAPRSGTGGIL